MSVGPGVTTLGREEMGVSGGSSLCGQVSGGKYTPGE